MTDLPTFFHPSDGFLGVVHQSVIYLHNIPHLLEDRQLAVFKEHVDVGVLHGSVLYRFLREETKHDVLDIKQNQKKNKKWKQLCL